MSNLIDKKSIDTFLIDYPNDFSLLKQYPDATHYGTDNHNCLILYNYDKRLVYIRKVDFDL